MANYVMTPARRAALRKAQLISAQKRRRQSTVGYALHNARQSVGVAYNQGKLEHYKNAPKRQLAGQKVKALPGRAAKSGVKYAAKRVAIGTAKAGLTIGAATAIGYTAYGMTSVGQSNKKHRARSRALGNAAKSHRKQSRANNKAASSYLKSMHYGKTTHVKSQRIHGSKIKALPRGR